MLMLRRLLQDGHAVVHAWWHSVCNRERFDGAGIRVRLAARRVALPKQSKNMPSHLCHGTGLAEYHAHAVLKKPAGCTVASTSLAHGRNEEALTHALT
jgi:hypothetical protein